MSLEELMRWLDENTDSWFVWTNPEKSEALSRKDYIHNQGSVDGWDDDFANRARYLYHFRAWRDGQITLDYYGPTLFHILNAARRTLMKDQESEA